MVFTCNCTIVAAGTIVVSTFLNICVCISVTHERRLRTLKALKWTRLLNVMLIISRAVFSSHGVRCNMASCLYTEKDYNNVVACEGNQHLVERVHQVFKRAVWGRKIQGLTVHQVYDTQFYCSGFPKSQPKVATNDPLGVG